MLLVCVGCGGRAYCSLTHPAGIRSLLVTRHAVLGPSGTMGPVRPSACLPGGGEACVSMDKVVSDGCLGRFTVADRLLFGVQEGGAGGFQTAMITFQEVVKT